MYLEFHSQPHMYYLHIAHCDLARLGGGTKGSCSLMHGARGGCEAVNCE